MDKSGVNIVNGHLTRDLDFFTLRISGVGLDFYVFFTADCVLGSVLGMCWV